MADGAFARWDVPSADARARGLGTHLLRRDELEALAGLDLRALADALERTRRFEPIAEPKTAASIEAAARRTAANHLRTLARWGASAALDVVHAEHDRRALRALLRGAATGAAPERRLAGLVPTRLLPERALVSLAGEPTASRVAAALVTLAYPGASALLALATRAQPVPLDLDLALLQQLAERLAASAGAGDENLRELVAFRLDTANAVTALALAAGPRDLAPDACFLDGGEALGRSDFRRAAAAESAGAGADALADALGPGPLADAARACAGDAVRLERAAMDSLLRAQMRRAARDPLSSAPVFAFLLRLDAQSADVRRLAWGAALGAPAQSIRTELATPWS